MRRDMSSGSTNSSVPTVWLNTPDTELFAQYAADILIRGELAEGRQPVPPSSRRKFLLMSGSNDY